ncbi:MAG: type II secretion system inner membrane protein GspF [Bdellovibrionaceae bacterium]|nr:type II secretion system inner membrane protein GspF [Pseudobdellovibrionaceae bacterium]
MPIYEYKGLNKSGKSVKGVVDADSLRAARLKLKKDGIFITELKDKKKTDPAKRRKAIRKASVPVKDLSLMTRQLATLIKANIPLVDALSAVSEQVENPVLAEAVADCKNMVNEGATLHKSLQKYPTIFNNIYVSLVEAGEASGSLDQVLLRLAEFTEAQAELKQKISAALTYPIIMAGVIVLIMAGLFTFVIPKMVTIFESAPELTLPWYTEVLIAISQFMVDYWYLVLGAAGIGLIIFRNWKNSEAGSKQWDALSLRLPLFGPIIRMVAVARFTRTLATLLNGGVPMLQALDIVRNVVDNDTIARAVDEARSNISEGESIAGPLRKSGQFPPIVIHMVNIGEKTGELESMLIQVADAYDFQVKTKVEGLTALINPVITIFMGVVIFIIVLSIIIPMFEMTNLGG